jgi:hypothetical protein
MNDTLSTAGLQLRKVTRQQAKLRIGLSGASGSGKTYSALLIAGGITDWDKVCVIDTENGSADLYDNLGSYNVIQLQAPFTPERYIQAIRTAQDAGMEVIIVDSVTHEWDGKGGILESNELLAQTRFKGNSWAAWSVSTPRHQKFIEAIVSSSCHVITTTRMKTDTAQIDGKIKKVGTKEIQREGFEYELTLNFNIDRDNHVATASKDRTGIFIDNDPFVITKETGHTLKDWAEKGVKPLKVEMPIEEKVEEVRQVAVARGEKNGTAKRPSVDTCESCHAPAGKPHATNCELAA